MTLLGLGASGLIGPGMRVVVLGVSGPVPVDDYLQAVLTCHAGSSWQVYGVLRPVVPGFNAITLGWDDLNQFIVAGTTEGAADGTAMDIHVIQRHASGTVVEEIGPTPYGALDKTAAAWSLMRFVAGGLTGDVAAILAAVRKNYVSPS